MTTDVVFTVSIPNELERNALAQSKGGLVRSKILADAIYNLGVFNQLNPEGMQNSLTLENGVKVSWHIPTDKEPGKVEVKPPIGLMPKKLHDEQVKEERLREVSDAIHRYQKAGKKFPTEWVEEYNELLNGEVSIHPNSQDFDLKQFISLFLSGIGGLPTNEDLYDEFDMYVKRALGLPENYGVPKGFLEIGKENEFRISVINGIINYIKHDAEILMPIVPGQTKVDYGKSLIHILCDELHEKFIQPSRLEQLKAKRINEGLTDDEAEEMIDLLLT